MGKSSPQAPQTASPQQIATAQGTSNVNTAIANALLNNTSQVTPYGTVNIKQTGSQTVGTGADAQQVPTFTSTSTPSAPVAQLIGQQEQLANTLAGQGQQVAGNIDTSKLNLTNNPNLAQVPTDPSTYNQSAITAAYNQATSRLNPQWDQAQRQQEDQLASQGLAPGSAAYTTAMDTFNRAKNDAYSSAENNAQSAGLAAAGQTFNESLSSNQQGVSNLLQQTNQPINELAALLQGSPAIGQAPTSGGAQVQVAPNNVGNAYAISQQGAQQNYQNQLASQNAAYGGLAGIGGTILGAGLMPGGFLLSSRKFKVPEASVDNDAVLQAVATLPVDRWHYKPEMGLSAEPHIGPYAEDFRTAFGLGDGVTINLVDALGVCLAAIKALSAKVAVLEGRA